MRLLCRIFLFFTLALLSSCVYDHLPQEDHRPLIEERSPYSISQEEALQNLANFLKYENVVGTSINSQRKVKEIYTIHSNKVNLKSEDSNVNDLVHVVNFEDNSGFAILAADTRISSDVLVVTEQGDLTEEQLLCIVEGSNRTIYSEYPVVGPGIVYSADSSVVDINPNTFNLYDPLYNDYLVGDFDDSGLTPIGIIADNGSLLIGYLAIEYVSDQINEHSDEPIYIDDEDSGLPKETTETIRETTYQNRVPPLLHFARYWNQDDPFNRHSPLVREYLIGQQKRASAGCVPLAISKMIAFHRKPFNINYNNGPNVNWDVLTATDSLWLYPHLLNSVICESAATLLRVVGLNCYAKYFYKGTFTFPKLAKNFLSNYYRNVTFQDYNTSSVVSTLNKGIPIFVCSLPEGGMFYQLKYSHAWNIDGYKYKITKKTINYYLDGIYDRTEIEWETDVMVHCDYGWSGHCNGYYVSGIFNLDAQENEDIELDDEDDEIGKDRNYVWRIKTITHDGPK